MGSINLNIGFANQKENAGFKYRDLVISIEKDLTKHDIKTYDDLDAIRSGLRNIFSWRKGQRVLNPEFGNPIHNLLYEPINDLTAKNIGQEINKAISQWEPRVSINNINVDPRPDVNEYGVTINYSIPSLNIPEVGFSMILAK